LKKARDQLDEARKIAGIGLAKAAARSAYYAALHAAQSFIVERTGRIAKTHSGVRSVFARLAKETRSQLAIFQPHRRQLAANPLLTW